MKELNTAIILLAAGSSSRMGSPKQLLAWGETTLLQNAINQAEASKVDTVVVVLGANSNRIRKVIPLNSTFVENPDWETGMGSSIACGMRHLLKSETEFSSILIMLGDQPLLDSDFINQMLATLNKKDKGIVAADYRGRAGVPALFTKIYFDQLVQLDAEFGAKALLAKNSDDIHLLDAGIKTADIDTTEDYQELIKSNN